MRKILTRASSKVKTETPRNSLPWISVATVSALALGFSALPFNITNGHLSLNQTQAAQNGNGGSQDNGGGSQGNGGGGGGQGPSTAGGGGGQGPSTAGGGSGPGGGNSGGGGPEGGLGGGSAGPSDSRGGDKGRDTPSLDRPDTPALGRPDTGRGNGTDNASGRGNNVVSESGKGFAPGPAQGRGVNELTSPLFSAPTPGKGKSSAEAAKADGAGKPSGRVDAAVTTNIQQRVGDQSGPDLDSNAEAALIERGWKR